jgi:Tfp pilus assembly protein PilN
MIEINLLPGAGRKSRRGGPSLDFGSMAGNLRERVRDPWRVGAIGATLAAAAIIGLLYVTQASRSERVEAELQKAVQDSTRYASVQKEREKAEAKRDTVLRSLNLIRAIDDDRFVWPHVMDEVSRALPPYTWLVSLGFSGLGQAQQPVATVARSTPADTTPGRRKRKPLQTVIPRDTVRIRIIGNTVDIQALTRFMKQLEASPFLESVQLAKSERANDHGKEVTQFQLDMLYSRPGPEYVRRVPLDVTVR